MYSSPFYFQTGLVAYTHMCIFVLETSETLRTFYYLFNNDSIAVRGKIIRLHLKCLFWWLLIGTLIYDEIFLQMKLFMVLVNFLFSSNEKNIRFLYIHNSKDFSLWCTKPCEIIFLSSFLRLFCSSNLRMSDAKSQQILLYVFLINNQTLENTFASKHPCWLKQRCNLVILELNLT